MGIRIADERWPLVVITWAKAKIDDHELADYLRRSNELLARGERMVVIEDATLAPRPTAKQSALIAEHLHDNAEVLRRHVVAVAIVTPSKLMRGAVMAINWLTPSPFPQQTFSRFAEAEAWVLAELAREQSGER